MVVVVGELLFLEGLLQVVMEQEHLDQVGMELHLQYQVHL
jgi:hypothetical protein